MFHSYHPLNYDCGVLAASAGALDACVAATDFALDNASAL